MDPGAKVIVSSGYSDDQVMIDPEKYGFCGIVAKPYSMEQLRNVLRNLFTENNTYQQEKNT